MHAELERRPLFVAALGLILGITLVLHPIHFLFLLPAPFLLRNLKSRAVLVFALVAGVFCGPGQDPPLIPDQYVTGDWRVEAMPRILPRAQMATISHDGVRLIMFYDGPISLCPGSLIRIEGLAKPPKEGFENYYRLESVTGSIDVKSSQLQVIKDGPWIQRLACDWRQRFLGLTSRSVPPDVASLEDSMCFRVDGFVDPNTQTEISESGTLHLLLTSGLQTILIGYTLMWILMRLPIPRWAQLALVAAILALYAIATGSSPTIIRVAVMTIIAQSAYLVRREPDWPSALAASSVLYLLWDPNGVYKMGFQFSFVAVFFIAIFAQHVKWKPGLEAWFYRMARRSVWTAIVAYVVTTPLLAYYFGFFSLVPAPTSLLLIVLVVPVVILSMAALPVSLLVPSAGETILKATVPLADQIYRILHVFGGPGIVAQTPPFSPYWLLPFYGALLVLWRPFVRQP